MFSLLLLCIGALIHLFRSRWNLVLDNHALRQQLPVVLRQNSMRTENSAIPCRDDCPIQVLPSPTSAKILSRTTTRAVYLCI